MLKVVGLSGSVAGSQTITTMREVEKEIGRTYGTEVNFKMLDLRDYRLQASDGRDFHEYDGDTYQVATTLAAADAIIVGTPIFQGSIPGALKNVFDLLPEDGFRGKVIGTVVNAGSPRFFLAAEYQLKPVLTAMKAEVISNCAFVEAREIYRTEIIEDATKHRIDKVARQTVALAQFLQQQES